LPERRQSKWLCVLAERTALALAASALAHAVQVFFLALSGHLIFFLDFVSHWLIVLAVHLAAALVLGGIRKDRLWAAFVFLFPITTVLLWGDGGARLPDSRALAVLCFMGLAGILWTALPLGRGKPLITAGAGSLAGGMMLVLQSRRILPREMGTGAIFVVFLSVILLVFFLELVSRGIKDVPKRPVSRALALFILFMAVSALWMLKGPAVPEPPPVTGAPDGSFPPVVLIVLDTVRADHLKMYGYERDTMPGLEAFAKKYMVVADRSIANGPSTLPTHASLFTGLYPVHHGAHKPFLEDPDPPPYAYPMREEVTTLAEILRGNGYWTLGISANFGPLSPKFGLSRGFDFYDAEPEETFRPGQSAWTCWLTAGRFQKGLETIREWPVFSSADLFRLKKIRYKRARAITARAAAAVEAAGDRPFFLFLNYLDAHIPYDPPGAYRRRFAGRNVSLGQGGLAAQRRHEVLRGSRHLTPAEAAHLAALYDGELSYLDSELRRLLDHLKGHPRWEDMLVVVTSDHGEALGEHGHLEHSISLYDEIVWVPLMIKPGRMGGGLPRRGGRLPGIVQSVDIFPGILSSAGLAPPEGIDGVPWGIGRTHGLSWLYVHRRLLRHNRQLYHQELRAVEHGGWKLIRSSRGTAALFDMGGDSGEVRNVGKKQPAILQNLTKKLDESEGVRPDPLEMGRGEPLTPETLDRLRSLGYVR
jgi:arylsulfatase A-like enzyme